jgi:UDP-3-O-[3-hydroxymyristoyl] glucosamine N-acyltransferase
MYRDLQCFLTFARYPDLELHRIDPDKFLASEHPKEENYINLVVRDNALREQVSERMSAQGLGRFSLIHTMSSSQGATIGLGSMIYPFAVIYPGAVLAEDVVVHSHSAVAHDCTVGQGCYISGGVTVAGSVTIGPYCQINLKAVIYDKISLCDHVIVGANTVIRKSITEPGTYANIGKGKLVQIKKSSDANAH